VLAAGGERDGRGRSSGRGGAAWRVREKTAGRARAAVDRGVTRGDCKEQVVALVRLQRRRAAADSSSGGWQSDAARRGKASARPEGGGEVQEEHVMHRGAARSS
jgi:hypothetical protein